MGQFSWLYSDTGKQVIDNKRADTYLLVPPPFQKKYGKAIYESCYDGYGHFGKYDIYELIIEWNRDMIPEIIRRIKNGNWHCGNAKNDVWELQRYYDGEQLTGELRWLGIIIACYDDDNFALEYPIKITTWEMEYELASPSESDPNQGWLMEDDEEDYDGYDEYFEEEDE